MSRPPQAPPTSGLKRPLSDAYRIVRSFAFDPLMLINKLRALPYFLRNALSYRARQGTGAFMLRPRDVYFTSFERFDAAGNAQGHYFHQDLWAARRLASQRVEELVDVGSRLDGFIAHVLPFCRVKYVDIRPLAAEVDGIEFVQGSLLDMPFPDNSVRCLSCLHVIEHVGLGRYGDDVDPDGHRKAASELSRVLAPGGQLLIGTPVGRQRLMFDAHRVFDPCTVIRMFEGLVLREFSLIDDAGLRVRQHASLGDGRRCEYGCGLFVFEKPLAGSTSEPAGALSWEVPQWES
jgi:SAM-dependent methyltransferase